jgi:hypothetical protein
MQRTEGHVDQLSVSDDRDAAVEERVKHELAVHVLVAAACTSAQPRKAALQRRHAPSVVRVHGHSGVTQHRLRTVIRSLSVCSVCK